MRGWRCNARAEWLPLLRLARWRRSAAALIGVFTDIDDTLTTEGAITPDALQALARSEGGRACTSFPSPGRPVGWCEPFGGATWPVDAIVAENGAVAFCQLQNSSKNGLQRLSDKR